MNDAAYNWSAPPPLLTLDRDAIHLWRASLLLSADALSQLRGVLSDTERARAERFRIERDRARFVAAHGILRDILSRYLLRRPEELRFETGPRGKPALAPREGGETLAFNMSHSGELALYAVTGGPSVGVDIERIRDEIHWERIAGRFFHPSEAAQLGRLPEGIRRKAFFSCWSRKEAYLKARGEGLSIPTRSFAVSVVPGDTIRIERVERDPGEAARWSLIEVDPAPGYVGAAAVAGSAARIERWAWSGE